MLGGDQSNHGAGACLVLELQQRCRDRGHESLIGAPQHETQLVRGAKGGVAAVRVFERPVDELCHELRHEPGMRGALRAREQDHHG